MNSDRNGKRSYDDILNLPHHISGVHPPMPVSDRAAQFSPFAALTGYEEVIRETGRLTGEKRELEEDAREILDEKLRMIREQTDSAGESALVSVDFFRPDERKEGGSYMTITGHVKKIDKWEHTLIMKDGKRIPLRDIARIDFAESV